MVWCAVRRAGVLAGSCEVGNGELRSNFEVGIGEVGIGELRCGRRVRYVARGPRHGEGGEGQVPSGLSGETSVSGVSD